MPDSSTKGKKIKFQRDRVVVLETNVDDVTGEVVSRAIERLIDQGAYDVTTISFAGKKGRIGQTIRVTAAPYMVEGLASILVEETGTLGVKTAEFERLVVPRVVKSVPFELKNYKGSVSVKLANINGVTRIKPEFAQVREISEETGVPLRQVLDLVNESARKVLKLE